MLRESFKLISTVRYLLWTNCPVKSGMSESLTPKSIIFSRRLGWENIIAYLEEFTAIKCRFDYQGKSLYIWASFNHRRRQNYWYRQYRQISAFNQFPNEKWYGGVLATDSKADNIPEATQFRKYHRLPRQPDSDKLPLHLSTQGLNIFGRALITNA